MDRKTMTADEIRKQFFISNQAFKNFLNLGVLSPVPDTASNKEPLYYADEVAAIRESLTSCNSSIKRLETVRKNLKEEIAKTNMALTAIQLNNAAKEVAMNSIIDSVALFVEKAVPNLKKTACPLFWLRYPADHSIDDLVAEMTDAKTGRTLQDYCNELYHEVEVMDATSLLHCLQERDSVVEENEALRERIKELEHKIEILGPISEKNISDHGFQNELTQKQITGLRKPVKACNFTNRVIHCFCSVTEKSVSQMTLSDIVAVEEDFFLNLRNVGKTTLAEINEKLSEYDLKLGMNFFELNGRYYYKDSI